MDTKFRIQVEANTELHIKYEYVQGLAYFAVYLCMRTIFSIVACLKKKRQN